MLDPQSRGNPDNELNTATKYFLRECSGPYSNAAVDGIEEHVLQIFLNILPIETAIKDT